MPCATVFGEISDKAVHRIEIRGIQDETAVLPTDQKISVRKLFQVKGQSRSWKLERFGDLANRRTIRAHFDEISKDGQSAFLSQCGDRNECIL